MSSSYRNPWSTPAPKPPGASNGTGGANPALLQHMDEHLHLTPDIVTLDVGGTHFKATKFTLLNTKEKTFFHGLLDAPGGPVAMQEDGTVFIDRDPEVFPELLRFLRSPETYRPPLEDPRRTSMLLQDCKFYGFTELATIVQSHACIVVDVRGVTFKTQRTTLERSAYFARRLKEEDAIGTEPHHLFIDRDPVAFEIILRFLQFERTEGGLPGPREGAHNFYDMVPVGLRAMTEDKSDLAARLRYECDFYGMQRLVRYLFD